VAARGFLETETKEMGMETYQQYLERFEFVHGANPEAQPMSEHEWARWEQRWQNEYNAAWDEENNYRNMNRAVIDELETALCVRH
jgi:uncharacterized short protein YbdD (DUF466 family)